MIMKTTWLLDNERCGDAVMATVTNPPDPEVIRLTDDHATRIRVYDTCTLRPCLELPTLDHECECELFLLYLLII
jgi:hypothetical protein